MEWAWILLILVLGLWLFDRHVTKQYWKKLLMEAERNSPKGLFAQTDALTSIPGPSLTIPSSSSKSAPRPSPSFPQKRLIPPFFFLLLIICLEILCSLLRVTDASFSEKDIPEPVAQALWRIVESVHFSLPFQCQVRMPPHSLKSSFPFFRFLNLFRYIVADFVEYWYLTSVSDNPDFPNDVRATLDHMITELSRRAVHVDWYVVHVHRTF